MQVVEERITPKIEVEGGFGAGADGAKGSLKVNYTGDGAERLAGALADVLSPFTESAGALGDMVKAYRLENAIRATARAQELAAKLGVPIRPVPPKFLLQGAEGASLEEPGTDDLTDMWASLLVDTLGGLLPTHLVFKRLLSEMMKRHVDLLRFVGGYDAEAGTFDFTALGQNALGWRELMGTGEPPEHQLDDAETDTVVRLLERINRPGLKLVGFRFGKVKGIFWSIDHDAQELFHNDASPFVGDHTFEYLKLAGLVELVEGKCRFKVGLNAYGVDVKAWHITDLGIGFLRACAKA